MDSNQAQPSKERITSNLDLVPLTVLDHLDDFWEIWREERGLIWSTQAVTKTREEALDFLRFILRKSEANPEGESEESDKFAIILEGEGVEKVSKCVGFVGTNRRSPQGLEVGYCVNFNYWGNGYASWALKEILRIYWEIDERSYVPHLVAKVDPRNQASEKIVRRVGAREGEVLESYYSRMTDEGKKKSDLRCWYLDRPRPAGSKNGVRGGKMD